MRYKFNAYGNQNILGTHKNTLEFTKEKHLTKNGDCIIGIDSDFDISEIKKLIINSKGRKLKMKIIWPGGSEEVSFIANTKFCSEKEIVIRKTEFISERTLGINSDKSSLELKRELIEFLKKDDSKIETIIEMQD